MLGPSPHLPLPTCLVADVIQRLERKVFIQVLGQPKRAGNVLKPTELFQTQAVRREKGKQNPRTQNQERGSYRPMKFGNSMMLQAFNPKAAVCFIVVDSSPPFTGSRLHLCLSVSFMASTWRGRAEKAAKGMRRKRKAMLRDGKLWLHRFSISWISWAYTCPVLEAPGGSWASGL